MHLHLLKFKGIKDDLISEQLLLLKWEIYVCGIIIIIYLKTILTTLLLLQLWQLNSKLAPNRQDKSINKKNMKILQTYNEYLEVDYRYLGYPARKIRRKTKGYWENR